MFADTEAEGLSSPLRHAQADRMMPGGKVGLHGRMKGAGKGKRVGTQKTVLKHRPNVIHGAKQTL